MTVVDTMFQSLIRPFIFPTRRSRKTRKCLVSLPSSFYKLTSSQVSCL
jgi:hypothetical protein